MTRLSFEPLTEERWPDFVRLFGERGVGDGCWCMFWRLPKEQYLRQHVSARLIDAAVAYVRSQGGRTVEGYPVPPKPGVTATSYVSAFEEAGFTECVRRSQTRPIMRYDIDNPGRRAQRAGQQRGP